MPIHYSKFSYSSFSLLFPPYRHIHLSILRLNNPHYCRPKRDSFYLTFNLYYFYIRRIFFRFVYVENQCQSYHYNPSQNQEFFQIRHFYSTINQIFFNLFSNSSNLIFAISINPISTSFFILANSSSSS